VWLGTNPALKKPSKTIQHMLDRSFDGRTGGFAKKKLTLTNVLANPVLLIYIFTTTLLRIFPCMGTRSGSLREMTEGSDERRSLAA
jgi:hypothetical protein